MVNLCKSESMKETNLILNEEGLASYNDSLEFTFRIKKKHFFTVKFGGLKLHTQKPYFSTSGAILNYTRSDFTGCGQCQDSVLTRGSIAKTFFEKWNTLHLKSLTKEQYAELLTDLEKLKENYPFIEGDRFNEIVNFDREMSK